ncbi:MAG: ABC transporter substrate-binding protein [Acidimicrobiales bacterium]
MTKRHLRHLRHMRPLRHLAVLVALLFFAAACGQKEGVHTAGSGELPEIVIESSGGGFGPGAAEGSSTGAQTGAAQPGGGGAAGSSGGGAAGGGGESGGAGGGAAAGGLTLSGSNRTGVSDDLLRVAVHAPVTGAAPLPAVAFEQARDLYWRYVTELQGQTVLGRSRVEVSFKDDKYTPNTAIQACRELAADAFLLVGGGGTDQIQACGQYAEQAGVPYLSAGVTEQGLQGLNWYFAASMSYQQQGALLAQYVKTAFPGKKVGAIITDTPNFDDAVRGWEDGVARQGLNYFGTLRHPKGNNSWITSFASDMKSAGVEVLFMLTAPTDYIQFAQQAGVQDYRPQFVGVGISMGLNAVLGAGCPDVTGGIFFSPFPGLDWARQNEPAYFQSGSQLGVPTDDLGFALWGLAKTQHEMFKRYEQTFGSTDLTREDFVAMLARQEGVQSGVFPQLSYTPENHFGASQVHVLQADCATGEYKTLAAFASGF